MTDVFTKVQRSRIMASIRGKNTKPEMKVRQALHRLGFRYSLHCKKLPGSPDLAFPKYKAAIFVNGRFWHGHSCRKDKLPRTRTAFWAEKIARNKRRDRRNVRNLKLLGWRCITVWECKKIDEKMIRKIIKFLKQY